MKHSKKPQSFALSTERELLTIQAIPFSRYENEQLAALTVYSINWLRQWTLRPTVESIKPGGALFLYHLPYWAARLSQELVEQLRFRHWIAIAMKNGFVRGKNLYPAHYGLLYFTKGEPARFSRPRLDPQLCRHCRRLVKDYGGYTSIIQSKGINLSDFWDDLSPVRHKTRKHRRANQLPVLLTDRVVAIAGFPGGLLVDPFAGTGTSLVSALQASMFLVANEMSKRSLRVCVARLHEASRSNLAQT